MPRYARRVDANQSDLVDALRKAGADVIVQNVGEGIPDLRVSWTGSDGARHSVELEVKSKRGTLTPAQIERQQRTGIPILIVRTVQDALRLIGREARPIDRAEANPAQTGMSR